MTVPLISLIFFTLIGCITAVWVAKRAQRILSFQFLVVVNYIAINLFSGVAHILDWGSRRGYYDAVSALEPQQLGQLVLSQCVGLIGLVVGLLVGSPPADASSNVRPPPLSRFDQLMLVLAIFATLPIALVAVLRIRDYASTLEVFGGRIISVDGGMARYVFLSHWLVWAVCFAVIWFAYGSFRRAPESVFLVAIAGIAVIVGSLSWSGGRSIALVFTLPLVMVIYPLLRRNRVISAISIGVGTLALLFYVARLSNARSAKSRSGGGNIWDWLDWEWGRFSMLGFGVEYVDKNGYVFGETLLSSLFRVLGFTPDGSTATRSSSEIASAEIFNSSSARYLAPGLSFELYLSFGVLGIFFGYLLVGWICKRIDQGMAGSSSVITQLLWAYVGTLVVFRVLPSEPSALLQALLYSGAPLLVIAALSYLNSRERRALREQIPRAEDGEVGREVSAVEANGSR